MLQKQLVLTLWLCLYLTHIFISLKGGDIKIVCCLDNNASNGHIKYLGHRDFWKDN